MLAQPAGRLVRQTERADAGAEKHAGDEEHHPAEQLRDVRFRDSGRGSQVDLVVFDNHYSEKIALRCARQLIAERVDLAIEFQTHQKISPLISSMFQAARIPMIWGT